MARRPVAAYSWLWEQDTIHPLWAPEPHVAGDLVVDVLEGLPRETRWLLEMRYWERLTFREIAVRIGKNSRGAAKYHVSKAERRFRDVFGEEYGVF